MLIRKMSLKALLLVLTVSFATAALPGVACADTASAALAAMPELPNHATNPGAINPNVTVFDEYATICHRGWTKTVRPPFEYTNKLKHQLLQRAGLPGADIHDFELDHLVSLELGGAPWDPRNLWLEPLWGKWNAHVKDQLENKLNQLVCDHKLALATAQYDIATNWIATYKRYVSPTPLPSQSGWGHKENYHGYEAAGAGYAAYRAYRVYHHYHRYHKWHRDEYHRDPPPDLRN